MYTSAHHGLPSHLLIFSETLDLTPREAQPTTRLHGQTVVTHPGLSRTTIAGNRERRHVTL